MMGCNSWCLETDVKISGNISFCHLTKLIKHVCICKQRFYRYLELKLKKPYAAVPPVDKTLKMITEPDPKLLAQNKSIIDEFKRRFVLKDNPKVHP